MITLSIPKSTPSFLFRCTLDQQSFQFVLTWNMRAGWFLSMSDSAGGVIFSSTRIVASWDMLSFCSAPTRPRGALLCLDSTGKKENPGFSDLGLRHELVYIPPEEVISILAAEEAARA